MFNIRKTVLLMFVFSPIVYVIIVGYPLLSNIQLKQRLIENKGLNSSKRCYAVNDWNKYLSCLKNSNNFLNKTGIVKQLNNEINSMNKGFSAIFFIFLIMQIALTFFIFGRQINYSAKDENKSVNV